MMGKYAQSIHTVRLKKMKRDLNVFKVLFRFNIIHLLKDVVYDYNPIHFLSNSENTSSQSAT